MDKLGEESLVKGRGIEDETMREQDGRVGGRMEEESHERDILIERVIWG